MEITITRVGSTGAALLPVYLPVAGLEHGMDQVTCERPRFAAAASFVSTHLASGATPVS